RWEAKWGQSWPPYGRREKPAYQALVERVRGLVRDVAPPGATVAVISKGDGELLRLDGRRAWHFPQGADGQYAGHYPADSDACIAELERARANGAEFLVIPATAQWWLQYYGRFGEHLQRSYRSIGDEQSANGFVRSEAQPLRCRSSATRSSSIASTTESVCTCHPDRWCSSRARATTRSRGSTGTRCGISRRTRAASTPATIQPTARLPSRTSSSCTRAAPRISS